MPLHISQQSWLPRRSSVSSPSPSPTPNTNFKGSLDSPDDFGYRYDHNADSSASKSSALSPPTAYDSASHSLHPQHSSSLPSRHHTNLLSVASDAFGFRKKFGSRSRKRPNVYSLSQTSNILPEVIEINASNNTTITTIGGATAHRDYEHEERERLRDVAAQSIGLDPELLHVSKSETRSSLDSPQNSTQPARIPPFPATLAALRPFIQLSSTFPKLTPPSSLLVFALSKQWKPRMIVLTSHSPSHNTHVHLFKGSSKDEREIERLEVTENSAIFVPEEDVGGRHNVVKLAGKDVSKRNADDTLHTMWFLQITDPAESQRWIAAIKNAVLTRRAARAGIDIPTQTNSGNEPKGDIDVMLSMHLQGLLSTHPNEPSPALSFALPPVPASPSPTSSLRSLKVITSSSPSPTTTMKGIFSGTRPRSLSVDGSPNTPYPSGHVDDSFGIVGTSLLTMLRTKSSAESNSSPSHSLPLSLPRVSGQDSPVPSLRSTNAPVVITAEDLKISKERDAPESIVPEDNASNTPPSSSTPLTPSVSSLGTLTLSLQPPPRKSKHAVVAISTTLLPEQQGMYKQAAGNRSVAGNFGISSGSSGDVTPREISPPVSPGLSTFSGGRSTTFGFEMQSRSAGEPDGGKESDEVIPTLFGNEIIDPLLPRGRTVPSDKLLQCTAITKRWSRQGIPLPKQLTPPSGPPPSVPPSLGNNHRISMESSISIPVTYATDRSPGSSSSNSDSRAQTSFGSGSSLPPTFWKRGSGCSTYSVSSTSTSDSRSRSQIPVGPLSGESLSSTYGSVVSKGTSSRPMSLLAPASLIAGHGTVKRRSMPPPRPAPNFAPPPAPTIQVSMSGPTPSMTVPTSRKSFRSSVAHRALRLSLTSPKPPPSSALPPRPDEAVFAPGHRRTSSTGSPDPHPISAPSSRPTSALSETLDSTEPISFPLRSLSIRQRLRLLSTPPASPSPVPSSSFLTPSVQVSTLDLSDDNDDDDLPTPCFHSSSQLFGLGEHITTIQNEPSFLQLSTPATPTAPKPLPRSPFQLMSPSSSTTSVQRTPPLEPDRDFVALSPPPRRGSKSHVVTVKRSEKHEVEMSGSAQRESEPVKLSQGGSVVSLGFVTS